MCKCMYKCMHLGVCIYLVREGLAATVKALGVGGLCVHAWLPGCTDRMINGSKPDGRTHLVPHPACTHNCPTILTPFPTPQNTPQQIQQGMLRDPKAAVRRAQSVGIE